jgi:hypothetical protein
VKVTNTLAYYGTAKVLWAGLEDVQTKTNDYNEKRRRERQRQIIKIGLWLTVANTLAYYIRTWLWSRLLSRVKVVQTETYDCEMDRIKRGLWLAVANTLAYYGMELITDVKRFMKQSLGRVK